MLTVNNCILTVFFSEYPLACLNELNAYLDTMIWITKNETCDYKTYKMWNIFSIWSTEMEIRYLQLENFEALASRDSMAERLYFCV